MPIVHVFGRRVLDGPAVAVRLQKWPSTGER
jgi:hypothetical protein